MTENSASNPLPKVVLRTHRQLLFFSKEIGDVHEMASWASEEIAWFVAAAGKDFKDMTVNEVLRFLDAHRQSVSRHKRANNG